MLNENEISKVVVECAIEVHRTLGGPGLLESVYDEALAWELQNNGLNIRRQMALPIKYKNNVLTAPLKIDLMIED